MWRNGEKGYFRCGFKKKSGVGKEWLGKQSSDMGTKKGRVQKEKKGRAGEQDRDGTFLQGEEMLKTLKPKIFLTHREFWCSVITGGEKTHKGKNLI